MRKVILALLYCLLAGLTAVGEAQEIERIEPPFWWTGFEHTELQLLVHAGGIAGYAASVSAPGVSVSRVEHGDSPNYLFVYLDIEASAAAGTFDIKFDNVEERIDYTYELRERRPGHVGTYDSSDVIYLITPGRFANGDPLNDNVDGYEDAADRNDDYGRHGGDRVSANHTQRAPAGELAQAVPGGRRQQGRDAHARGGECVSPAAAAGPASGWQVRRCPADVYRRSRLEGGAGVGESPSLWHRFCVRLS